MSNATLRHWGFGLHSSLELRHSSFLQSFVIRPSQVVIAHFQQVAKLSLDLGLSAQSASHCLFFVPGAILLKEALLDLPELFFDARVNHATVGLDQATAARDQRILDKLDAVVP